MKTTFTQIRGVLVVATLTFCSPIFAALPARDEAAIRAKHDKYAGQLLAQDWASVADVRTATAVFMPPNERAKTGSKEIVDWHKAFPPLKTFMLKIEALDGSGDLAVLHGRYALSFAPPNQPETSDSGKYLQMWRKQRDGTWKIERDIFNSDLPPSFALTKLPAQDESAIRAVITSTVKAGLAGDWANFKYYADDAIMLPANASAQIGVKAIMEWNRSAPAITDWKHEPAEIIGNGNFAVVRGQYTNKVGGAAGTGKFLELWRKESDGTWKVFRNAWNSDSPASSAATTTATAIIVGTYKLVSRKLPDGRMVYPPTVNGMINITPTMMNFNLITEIQPGKVSTGSFLCSYQLTDSEYRETRYFDTWIDENGKHVGAAPIPNRPMPVKRIGATIEFTQPPLRVDGKEVSPPSCVYDGKSIVATKPGEFVDTWEKVNDAAPMPARMTDAMLDGAWELNVAKSRFSPGPGPRRETRTYTITADGQQRATYEGIDADGKAISGSSTYSLDGKDAPIIGRSEADAQALTRTGPRTISGVIKKGGKILSTATREVSEDGKTMTITFKGVNAKGQPLDDVWVFDRKADTDEQTIRKIEQDWAVALVKADTAYIEGILSPDWVRTSPDGKLHTKADSMAALTSGGMRFETFKLDELKVRVSGDSAVALGLVTTQGSFDGKGFAGQSRFTDTFVKRDGKWLCVATHGSRIEKTGGDVAAAVKAEIEKHYASISRGDDGWKAQHTLNMSMFSPEFDKLMLLNSPTWLAALAARGEHTLNWKARDIEVQTFGNTAVATFYMDGSVTRKADGAVDSRPRRVSEVWVNENGTWKEAHHHDSVYTAVPKAAALANEDRARIVSEIKRTLDDYKDVVMRKDLSAVKGFWSDAEQFVFAGDGTIHGGAKTWYEKLDWYHQDTAKWNSWHWRKLHVEPLALDAASATVEFENSRDTVAGSTANVRGSWTYVFKKDGSKWRVIHSNGTHVAL